ncbi:MAG: DEAD/DEAH box helicase [Candidatus Gastranaerophilales bacterium]|nr:DEAD/DEAH box helicase [Candidatus Gastranaerophilales bacterium]
MYEFDFELDDFQKEAISHIKDGKSVVVCAPTGAGKTCIAESAIHLALENGSRIFYTTPLKALSNQKFYDFSKKYGEDKTGLLTGDTSINRNAQILVMTTEVFRNMLYGTTFGSVRDNLADVRYVVLDEVHYMNDESRGTVWEESIIYCPFNIQIIALSATVKNSKQLADWINGVHGKTEEVYTDFRPVPLRFYYYDSSKQGAILPLITPNGGLNTKIKPESRYKYFNSKTAPKNPMFDIVEVLSKRDMLPCIYFTFSRRKCDDNALALSKAELLNEKEAKEIEHALDEYLSENLYLYGSPLLDIIKKGVAPHHAGLLPGLKNLIERLFQRGLIKVVFATETLAAGINMPARTTVISSISKRTDDGHRLLSANEFLQMSGRAGRRGMDEIGYVVIVGTPFQTPEEVYNLVTSGSNPLESKFAPRYSMVLNLLQRFSLEEAKELILKTFGYFSSNERLSPLVSELERYERAIDSLNNFNCHMGHNAKDMEEFIKYKNLYIEYRTTLKALKRQNKKSGYEKEIQEFAAKTSEITRKVHSFGCNDCKAYKKHKKELELIKRYEKKARQLKKEIDFQKDIYWQKFLAHKKILEIFGNLKDDYPTEFGKITMALRCENELYISEIVRSGVLNNLNPECLASVVCALSCEEMRGRDNVVTIPPLETSRKVLSKIKDIRRKIFLSERDFDLENPMNLHSHFSGIIEKWVKGNLISENDSIALWNELFSDTEFSEGDVVRAFKRTIDLLRQFTVIDGVDEALIITAKEAIKAINREPVNIE